MNLNYMAVTNLELVYAFVIIYLKRRMLYPPRFIHTHPRDVTNQPSNKIDLRQPFWDFLQSRDYGCMFSFNSNWLKSQQPLTLFRELPVYLHPSQFPINTPPPSKQEL